MHRSILYFCLLAAVLFSCAVNADESSVSLHVFGSSNTWWVAVQPHNDGGATTAIWIKDSSHDFVEMEHNSNWGYYASSAFGNGGFVLPITFELHSASGVITTKLDSITPDAIIDTGARFGSSAPEQPQEEEPSSAEPSTPSGPAPAEPEPEPTPAESASEEPEEPSAPAEPAPAEPSEEETPAPPAPSNTDLCAITSTSSEPLKILVPLYVYPGAAWDALVDAASKVKIIAIINPNSGPLPTVDSAYTTYMTKLHNAGIELVGYVHTTYGQRAINDVKADINTYANNYPLVTGIFFDEAANEAGQLSYYRQCYDHVMSKSGYDQVILNPGVQPDEGYLAISTNIVIFENYATSLPSASYDSWVKCAPSASEKAGWKYRFSGIVHTASASSQASIIESLANKGMGLVYVTDGAGGCCTYNELVSYFSSEASAVQSLN